MLGQVRAPLVSGRRSSGKAELYRWLVPLGAGLLTGAAGASAVAAIVGIVTSIDEVSQQTRLFVFLVAVSVFIVADLQATIRGTVTRIGLKRQTPQRFKYSSRRGLLAYLWGIDIGTGVSTYRVTTSTWTVLLAIVLQLVPAYVGLAYGCGLVLVLAPLIASGVVGSAVADRMRSIMAARGWIQKFHLVAIVSLAVGLLVSG